MRLLVDEMYSPALVRALQAAGHDAVGVRDVGLAGAADAAVFAAARDDDRAVLTENVGDFTRLAADHSAAGRPHPGVLIALSSRFSRRPAGIAALVRAVDAVAGEDPAGRTLSLAGPANRPCGPGRSARPAPQVQ